MFSTVGVYASPAHGASQVGSYAYNDSALADVINFHSGSRLLRWRFDLISPQSGDPLHYKGDVTPYVTKAQIAHDGQRTVKRTLDLTMVETVASQTVTVEGGTITSAGIDYLNDCIQPWCLLGVPGTSTWVGFPLGVFRFDRPGVQVPGFAVVRSASMPDRTSMVQLNAATDQISQHTPQPLTLPAGCAVIDVIRSLLMNAPTNGPSTPDGSPWATPGLSQIPGCALGDLLPSNVPGALSGNTPGDWPTDTSYPAIIPTGGYIVSEGQSYLDLINHLAYTIGLNPLIADERGILRLYPWPVRAPSYTLPSPRYTYDTTHDSIVQMGLSEDILVDDVANVVEVIVEDTQRQPFKAIASNDDPASPYNLANLKRRVVKTVRDGQVPDTAAGIDYAARYAKDQLLRASWLTDRVTLPIAVNPLHCGGPDNDAIALNIYQQYVAAGSPQNNPVIVGFTLDGGGTYPGLVVTETFLVDGWTITAQLAQPGSSSNLTGNVGLSTVLEPRESKSGSTMTLTAHRITSTVRPSYVTVTS